MSCLFEHQSRSKFPKNIQMDYTVLTYNIFHLKLIFISFIAFKSLNKIIYDIPYYRLFIYLFLWLHLIMGGNSYVLRLSTRWRHHQFFSLPVIIFFLVKSKSQIYLLCTLFLILIFFLSRDAISCFGFISLLCCLFFLFGPIGDVSVFQSRYRGTDCLLNHACVLSCYYLDTTLKRFNVVL